MKSPSDLNGLYLALGPVGGAVRVEGDWDGVFGAELALLRVREHDLLSAAGIAVGAHRFSARTGGRLWADVVIGHRRPFGLAFGLSAGVTAEVDRVRPPRLGGHGTLWAFVGVVPYLRLGTVDHFGPFVELGLKIALPALRW